MKAEVSTNQQFNREQAFTYTSDPRLFGNRKKALLDISQKETIRTQYAPNMGQKSPAYNNTGNQHVRFQLELGTDSSFILDTEASTLQITVEIFRAVVATDQPVAAIVGPPAFPAGALQCNDTTGHRDCVPWMLPLMLIQDFSISTSDSTSNVHAYNQQPNAYFTVLQHILMTQWDRYAARAQQFLICNSDGSMLESRLDNNYQLSPESKMRSHEFCAGLASGVYTTFNIPLSLLAPCFSRGYFIGNARKLWITMNIRKNNDALWSHFSTDPLVGGSGGVDQAVNDIRVNVIDMVFQIQQVRLAAVAEGSNVSAQRNNDPEVLTYIDSLVMQQQYTGSTINISPCNNFLSAFYGFRAVDVLGWQHLGTLAAPTNSTATLNDGVTGANVPNLCFTNACQLLPPQAMTVGAVENEVYGGVGAVAINRPLTGACVNIGTWMSSTALLVGASTYPLNRLILRYPYIFAGDNNNIIRNSGRQSWVRGNLSEAYMLYKLACNWHGKRLGAPLVSFQQFETCYSFILISTKDLMCLSESAPNQRVAIEYQQGSTGGALANNRLIGAQMTICLNTLGACQVFPDSSCAVIRQAY